MNGWTELNSELRCSVIKKINPDIICLTETHLLNVNKINLDGYTCYVNNRKGISARAIRGSGGVAILLSDFVIQNFIPKLKTDNVEGIIGIEL